MAGVVADTAYVELQPQADNAAFARSGAQAGNSWGAGFQKQVQGAMSGVQKSVTNTGFGNFGAQGVQAASAVARAMSNLHTTLLSVGQQLSQTGQQLSQFGRNLSLVVTAPAVAGLGLLGKVGLQAAMELEVASVALKAMLPVGYDVEALMTRMKKKAIDSSVFDLNAVVGFTKTLVGAGVTADKSEQVFDALNKTLTAYPVTAVQAEKAILGLSQVFRKGRVYSEELTGQIGEQIPIWSLMAQVTGKTQAELQKLVKDGDITSDMFAEMLVDIGNLPAVMQGATDGAKTLSAQYARLKENLKTRLAVGFLENFPAIKAALAGLEPILNNLVDWFVAKLPGMITNIGKFITKLKEMAEWWNALDPKTREQWERMLGLLIALGPALVIAGQAMSGLGAAVSVVAMLTNPWVAGLAAAALAIAGVGLAGWQAYKNVKEFREGVDAFVDTVKKGWQEDVLPAFSKLKKTLREDLMPALEDLLHSLGFDSWKEFGQFLGVVFINHVVLAIETIEKIAVALSRVADMVTLVIENFKAMKNFLLGYDKILAQGEGAGQLAGNPEHIRGQLEPLIGILKLLGEELAKVKKNFDLVTGSEQSGKVQGWADQTKAHFMTVASAAGVAAVAVTDSWKKSAFDVTKVTGDLLTWLPTAYRNGMATLHVIQSEALAHIRVIWNTFFEMLRSLWTTSIGAILLGAQTFAANFRGVFSGLVAGVRDTWASLREIFAAPIRFVVNEVYNGGLRKMFNAAASVLKIDQLPESVAHFAGGGVLGGSKAAGDWVPFYGTAGEVILSHDMIKNMGGYAGVEQLAGRKLDGSGAHYADGGILGTIGGLASKLFPGNILKTLTGVVDGVKGLIGRISSDPAGKMASGAGSNILEGALGLLKGKDKAPTMASMAAGYAGPVGAGPGFTPWPGSSGSMTDSGVWMSLLNLVKESGIPYSFGNSFRPGDPLWHGDGRAIDFSGYNQDALAQFFMARMGSVLELIHSTDTANYGVTRGQPNEMGAQLWGEHKNHLHVAMDQGGPLMPGRSIIDNMTGRPETVLNPAQGDALRRRIEGGDRQAITLPVSIDLGRGIREVIELQIDEDRNVTVMGLRAGKGSR